VCHSCTLRTISSSFTKQAGCSDSGRVRELARTSYGNGAIRWLSFCRHKTGLASLENRSCLLGEWLGALDRSEPTSVILSLPRFETHSELGLMKR